MHDRVTSRRSAAGAGWLLPLVFLALPNCSYNGRALSVFNLERGTPPHSSAIFCDIEQPLGRHCATAADKERGILFSQAAVALNQGQTSQLGLDDSPEALARCGGEPEAVLFRCPFPQGCPVCLGFDGIAPFPQTSPPSPGYADATGACVARCQDFFGDVGDAHSFDVDRDFAGARWFCAPTPAGYPSPAPTPWPVHPAYARVSTNVGLHDGGFVATCTGSGGVRPEFDNLVEAGFPDPRRRPKAVTWTSRVGAAASGLGQNTLTRTMDTTGLFDAGALSVAELTRGDGFFEFTPAPTPAGPTYTERVVGFGSDSTAPGLGRIVYGVDVSNGGNVYLIENGAITTTLLIGYATSDRFRVSIEAGLFKVFRNGLPLHVSTTAAAYPLRIDAALLEKGAVLKDVTVVYINTHLDE